MKAIEAFKISKLGINTNLIPKIIECAYEGKTELNATTQIGYDAEGYELTYKDINWLDQNGYKIEHRVVDLWPIGEIECEIISWNLDKQI